MATWPPAPVWIDDPTRSVATNGHYLVVVVVPAKQTEDEVLRYLFTHGWDVKSLQAAPADIAAAILQLLTLGFTDPPQAWLMNAFWRGSSGVLPAHDGNVYYGAVAHEYTPQRPPLPEPGPAPSQEERSHTGWALVALAGLATIAAARWWFRSRHPHGARAPA